ncbi:GntR family transcriptional regulator [Rhizobium sp. LjRoot30]|uniref:GntR family transcriptional regulator n=1 Tax=Rhizobium sp. LjRoot30 TaxID=3342320 RepID=UPI003ECE45B0
MTLAPGPIPPRVTVQDAVYQRLRDALMAGSFDPGQVLTIASLAERFGTSNMPVREALRRLGAEKALELAQNGSARVPAVTVARLEDLARARVAVEGLAAELGAPRLTARDLAGLEAIVAEQRSIGRDRDVYDLMAKNYEFHFVIYRASGSEVLLQLIETLWLRFGPYMRLLQTSVEQLIRSGEIEASGQHDAVLAALKAGDFGCVREAIVHDITWTADILQRFCPDS